MKKLVMFIGILALLASVANATIQIRISNPTGPAVNDTGWINCAGNSCIFAGAIGNYFVTSNISARLDPLNPFLDMSYSASTTVVGAGTIIIETIANGYTSDST